MDFVVKAQNLVLNMTHETYDETVAWMSASLNKQDKSQLAQILRVVLTALEYRPQSIDLIVKFTSEILVDFTDDGETTEGIFMSQVFNPILYFSSVFAMFMRKCYTEYHLVTPERLVSMMQDFKAERSELVYEHLTFFCWFCPEIEKYNPKLFNELLALFKRKSVMPNFLSSLKAFIDDIDTIRADNWKLHKEMTESLVGIDPVLQAILKDDVAQLQLLRETFKLDLNARMKPDVFCITKFLQRYPTLIQACGFLGAEKCFEYLLNEGADLELCNYANRTLGQFIVAGGNRKILDMAMKRRCNFTGALQIAALYHRNEIFHWLYRTMSFDLSAGDENLGSVIHQAAKADNVEITMFCIEQGVNVNIRNSEKCTPLHLACEFESINVQKYLLSVPDIEVNPRDVIRRTPLHNACNSGNSVAVQMLIEHKNVDINTKNKEIRSPLMCAVISGRKNAVELLLSSPEIDCRTIDGSGMTPLHWAARNNRLNTMKVLISKLGVDVNTREDNGKTALHWAAVNGFVGIMKLLLAQPTIDVNARADEGVTPLHTAMQGGHVKAIKELMDFPKTDVNSQNAKGQTILHMAAAAGNLDIVKLIISFKKVNLKLKTVDGSTAVDIAKQYDNQAVFGFLSSLSQGDMLVFVTV